MRYARALREPETTASDKGERSASDDAYINAFTIWFRPEMNIFIFFASLPLPTIRSHTIRLSVSKDFTKSMGIDESPGTSVVQA